MSRPVHTPGPWEAELDEHSGLWVTGPDRDAPVICDVMPRRYENTVAVYTDEDVANADLIANAPALRSELERLINWFGKRDARTNELLPAREQAPEIRSAMITLSAATMRYAGGKPSPLALGARVEYASALKRRERYEASSAYYSHKVVTWERAGDSTRGDGILVGLRTKFEGRVVWLGTEEGHAFEQERGVPVALIATHVRRNPVIAHVEDVRVIE